MWLCSTLARIASGVVDLAAVEEDGGAGDALQRGLAVVQLVDERAQRALVVLAPLGDQLAAALPGGEHGEHGDAR